MIEYRALYVKFKVKTSALHAVKSGVPQGSLLGPIIYLLYTEDIPIPRYQYSMIATKKKKRSWKIKLLTRAKLKNQRRLLTLILKFKLICRK